MVQESIITVRGAKLGTRRPGAEDSSERGVYAASLPISARIKVFANTHPVRTVKRRTRRAPMPAAGLWPLRCSTLRSVSVCPLVSVSELGHHLQHGRIDELQNELRINSDREHKA